MNRVVLSGRLGRDPELRYTPTSQAVAGFSLAIDESYRNSAGEKVDRVLWVDVVAWRKTAEICNQYLKKGRQVIVEGKLQRREWTDRESGNKRWTWEVVANHVEFVGNAGGTAARSDAGAHAGAQDGQPPAADDDDIPF